MLRKIIQPGRENWVNLNMANCYQFAIGYRKDRLKHLMPGELSGYSIPDEHRYSDDELFLLVEEDLKSMGYEIQRCEKNTNLSDGEWEICILNCSQECFEYDFHFIARFESGGEWFQKFAGKQLVEYVNSPESGDYDFLYHIVGYYKIRKVEE